MKTRMEKFKTLAAESAFYRPMMQKLPEAAFDEIVEFIEDNADLTDDQWVPKVNRMYLDKKKPKYSGQIQDILLAIRLVK